jgi:TPR repeat protein
LKQPSRNRFSAALAAAAIFSAAPALADYKAGMDALAVKDYVQARAEFEVQPDSGAAVYQLSRMATLGLGEPRNDSRATNLLRRASDLGYGVAKIDYAFALGNGRGAPKNGAEAVRILEEAARGGDLEAIVTLGRALRFGWWGVTKDEARAASLFQQGMDRGSVSATALYAQMLIAGTGVAKDETRGVELLKQSAERGHAAAQIELARMQIRGEIVPKDQPAAVALYRKAAETGNSAAQHGLAMAYLNGWGVPRDPAAGARWADASARQGYAWAQMMMGDAFNTGVGVPRARSEAFFWYSLAARSTDSSVVERANERRAVLAKDMPPPEIAGAVKKAEAFVPQPGFRPRQQPLPPLAHGDQVTIGSVTIGIPAPKGYTNSWQLTEWLQQAYPNDPSLYPLLMVLTQQEDVERTKLRLPGPYRSIEIGRHVPDDSVPVTAALFADIKKKLRGDVEARAAAGQYRVEGTMVDDDHAYAVVRSGISNADRIDAIVLVLARQRLLVLNFTGFRPEHLGELKELVKNTAADVLSSNRSSLFSQ